MSTAKWKKRTGLTWKQWVALRATVAAQQAFVCPHCGRKLDLSVKHSIHLHHINGDTLDNWVGNLEAVHEHCHIAIHKKLNPLIVTVPLTVFVGGTVAV